MKSKEKKRKKYSSENMKIALEMVRSGQMSKKRASILYGVPRTTLLDKLAGRVPEDGKPGPHTVLTKAEEKALVAYLNIMSDIGYPLTRAEFLKEVKRILDKDCRKTPFPDNLPGKGWFQLFKSRNPEITERKPQLLGRERAAINMDMIRAWYTTLFAFLEKEVPSWEMLIANPRRIFNADESGFPLCITSNRVLSSVAARHVYQVVGNNKAQITVMACMNALGDYLPPLIVFPGQRLRNIGLTDFPEAVYGHSENGWMDGDLFLEFLKTFVTFVEEKGIEFPVILFVDGHSTHMSLAAAEFCATNKVILYCLLPNATHILQACDIGLFSPMKSSWKKNVKDWQMNHIDEVFTKSSFPEVFKKTWYTVTTLETSCNGFKRAGLFPLSIDGIDMSKLGPSKVACPSQDALSRSSVSAPTEDGSYIAASKREDNTLSSDANGQPLFPVGPTGQVASLPTDNIVSNVASLPDEITAMPLEEAQSQKVVISSSVVESDIITIITAEIHHDGETPVPATVPVPKILEPHINRDENQVSEAFSSLRVPEPKQKKARNTIRSKLPKALSGSDALKMLWEREQKKMQQEEEKARRKAEREMKKKEKMELLAKRKEEREQKKIQKEKEKLTKKTQRKRKGNSEPDIVSSSDHTWMNLTVVMNL